MRRTWTRAIAAVLAAATVGGCAAREQRPALPFSSLRPEATRTGGELGPPDAETSPLGEEVSPARPAAASADSDRDASKPAAASPVSTGFDYRARLGEVDLPVGRRVRMKTGAESGSEVLLADTILAKVNDEVITREDVLGPVRPRLAEWRGELPPAEFERRCRMAIDLRLREEISERLVVQEARRELTEAEKEHIEATLGQFLKDLTSQACSIRLLEEKLKLKGRTVEEELDAERERRLVQRFLRDRVAPKVHVSHSELLDHYEQVRQERFSEPIRIRMRLIVLKKSEFARPEEARRQAATVMSRLRGGESFARLARRYSHGVMAEKGGDWGYVTRGAFRVKEVDEVLFSLRTGEVGPLVETSDACYLVKAEHRKDARILPFTEVQGELEAELRDKRYNQIVARYIQDLYDRSYVQVMTENL